MKNIFSGVFFVLILLPQASFGANQPIDPQLEAFIQKQDAEARAFFDQQATERGAWMKSHPDIIAKIDNYGHALMAYKEAQRQAGLGSKTALPLNEPTPVVDSTYEAFKQKQAGDKLAFLQKLAQEKQAFLNSHPGINP